MICAKLKYRVITMFKRNAFTMMEIIFIIVILGILAAVAIPKLAATRDDAKISQAAMHLAVAVSNAGTQYTAVHNFNNLPASVDCFSLSYNAGNGEVTVAAINSGSHCADAHSVATTNGLIGTHKFGGSQVSI